MGLRRLYIGRLDKKTASREMEEIFSYYGPMSRCAVRYNVYGAFAFIDYEDSRDAEEAKRKEEGTKVHGIPLRIEWAKAKEEIRRALPQGGSSDLCYRCGKYGHFGRDCRMPGFRNFGRGRTPPSRRRRSFSRTRSRSPYRRRDRSPSYERSRSRSRSRHSRSKHSSRRTSSPNLNKSRLLDRRSGSPDKRSRSPDRPSHSTERRSHSHRSASHRSQSRRSRSRTPESDHESN